MTRIAAALAVLAVATAASAKRPCTFDSGISATVVEYWHARPGEKDGLRCTGHDCSLSGWLVTSDTPKAGSPLIIFLQGSGASPTHPFTSSDYYVCTLANYFIPKGYAIFMPYMRGYADLNSFGVGQPLTTDPHRLPGFSNTGESYDTFATAQGNAGGHGYTWWTLFYMANHEMTDIQSAITFILKQPAGVSDSRPLVDPDRIAIAGHSFGGARAVLATNAHFKPRPRAVVDLSGAAMSWVTPDGGDWGGFLEDAAANREMPLYLQMNTLENPYGYQNPVIDVFNAADGKTGVGEAVAMLYSQFNIPADAAQACVDEGIPDFWCAHSWFVSSTVQSARWLPHVEDFLKRHGL